MGNPELLAVVLALQEWRHWLEGASHPFVIWTNHKNLSHLRTARQLNSRQTRWALFLGHFSFTITYQPGVKNVKPDALSRQFPLDRPVMRPFSCKIVSAHLGTCLPHRLPSRSPPHRQRFWWPSMAADVRAFVAACTECAQNKATHRPTAVLLQPLPIPSRPWSHITVDFVTGLPLSEGNNTILTIVDWFSKAVHFVPLPKLPSALETSNPLISHVFRLHGIPVDIVSDRGPQFTSQVCKTFCKALGATTSLTSGYHPQSNRQAERAN